MRYDSSNSALKDIGESAGYEDPLDHYNFRRWTANEANRKRPAFSFSSYLLKTLRNMLHFFKPEPTIDYLYCAGNFTDQERNRILGYSGTRIFEKHYQDNFIQCDLQSVVLLRPSQEALCRAAAQINKNRDPLAPTGLTEEQLKAIRRRPRIVQLRREREELKKEMRSLEGTIEATKEPHLDLYQRHQGVCRELARVRDALRREAWVKTKKEYHSVMPAIEVDKQIDQLLGQTSNMDTSTTEDMEWNPRTPEYVFAEQARIVDTYYGLEAETSEGPAAVARRIQVTTDLKTFCGLREPSRRGKRFNWNKDDGSDESSGQEASLSHSNPLKVPSDICIICAGDCSLGSGRRPCRYLRVDSLRRHLMKVHLSRLPKGAGVRCTLETCKGKEPLPM
jgi:Protein of unknown function (DUF3435)